MLRKILPISTMLLLSSLSAIAQDNNQNNTTGVSPTPLTTPDVNGTNTMTPGTTSNVTTTPASTVTTPVSPNTMTTTPGGMTTTPASNVTTTPGNSMATPPEGTTTSGSNNVTGTTTSVTTTTTSTAPSAFMCVGSNPNWNLSISNTLITMTTPDNRKITVRNALPASALGDTSGNVQAFVAKTREDRPVVLLVKRNATGCMGGLPGQSYQFDAFVVYRGNVITGCCNPG